jgi:hypothetical protein
MITDRLSFDLTGLVAQPSDPELRRWVSERGFGVILATAPHVPKFPATKAGQAEMVNELRRLFAEGGAGLVELSYVHADGHRAVRTITKRVVNPETGRGRRFMSSLEIEVDGSCLWLGADCSEAGITGFRETFVVQQLLASGALTLVDASEGWTMHGADRTDGWVVDPLDPTPPHLALNVSDDRRYDADFPKHPLSLVRAFLDRAQSSITIAPA